MLTERLAVEFEQSVWTGGQYPTRVWVDGFRGDVLAFTSLQVECDSETVAIVLVTHPEFGEVVEVPIHKLRALTPDQQEAPPLIREVKT